ncbi:MAG TPA: Trk family potassium uptake protein [Planctomycetes bacterium]|nr:Trk family potassium uptake protein [Planctomycetota bacterium]
MNVRYKNKRLETVLIAVTLLTSIVVAATFVFLYGFYEPLMSLRTLHLIQIGAFMVFLAEKTVRFVNAFSKREFLRVFWFEIPLLFLFIIVVLGAGTWFSVKDPAHIKMLALGTYLMAQVVAKTCRACVNLAATGQNPARTLIVSFCVLIIAGAGMLMLPKSFNTDQMSFVDALFTATSATCVTGLIVRDTGQDFSLMGQIVILTLIQLGGLGIVIFGAVLALLLGQALSVRESVAMQDLLSAQTLGRISKIIGFIFVGTITFEAVGAVSLLDLWRDTAGAGLDRNQQWFYSVFHSISAFCNAGFCLFSRSLIDYNESWRIYIVIAPLIVLGGLGFGVLYNLFGVGCDKVKRLITGKFGISNLAGLGSPGFTPVKLQLQTRIVLATSFALIIAGTLAIIVFGRSTDPAETFCGALFQSITARTAGFNTIDIASLTAANKLILIVLMFIGGSPGSTAGGIKTVTFVVIIMVVYATLGKKRNVEIFKRSIRPVVVGRAITVTVLFAAVLLFGTLLLTLTESESDFAVEDIMFETASALGTVGLSAGITPHLTAAGKLIIIATMLIGRLGPLTLLASLMFNLKPAGYDYPSEPIIVG